MCSSIPSWRSSKLPEVTPNVLPPLKLLLEGLGIGPEALDKLGENEEGEDHEGEESEEYLEN